jgi:arylsulfatase I/J
MVNWLDSAVGNVTDLLMAKGMWEDTLVVFTSDNGGPVYWGGTSGANNYPLRGGKASNWQGGIHVNAFVTGGLLPAPARGRKLSGLGAVWDWYGTFAHLAGVDPTDHRAAATGLPPVDSLNLWPYVSGQTQSSPRTEIAIGSSSCSPADPTTPACINDWGWGNTTTIVQGILVDEGEGRGIWKLLLGKSPMNGWQGPKFPNASTAKDAFNFTNTVFDCGAEGCLFRVDQDPSEHHDLSGHANQTARMARMMAAMVVANSTTFSPDRGEGEGDKHITEACDAAIGRYGGFFGPFLNLTLADHLGSLASGGDRISAPHSVL